MTPDVVTQLERYGEHADQVAPPLTVSEVMERRAPDMALQARPRHPHTAWAVAIAAAVITTLIIAVPLLLLGGGADDAPAVTQPTPEPTVATTVPPPATTVPPTPTTEVVPPASVPPALPPSLDSVGSWQRVGDDVMEPSGGLFDITRAGQRLVAVGDYGGEDGRPDGVIFVSDDGFTWTRVAEDDAALATGAVLMYAITEGGPGLVAVGGGCDDPEEACAIRATAWTSVDGTAWTRTPYDIEVFGPGGSLMEEVLVTEHGIVAVGRTGEVTDEALLLRPAVWISADGIEWARAWEGAGMARGLPAIDPPETGAFVLSPMQAITVGPDGTLVAVGTAVDELGVGVAAVWTSGDGQNWERVPHDPGVFAGSTGMDVVMLDVTAGESGFVAVGSERDHQGAGLWWMGGVRPAVWTSADGTAWERITLDDQAFEAFATTRSISTVAASPTGFVTAGPIAADSGPVTIWTSADGTRWQVVASFGAGYASSVIEAGPAMAAAGGMDHAAVWVGPPGT